MNMTSINSALAFRRGVINRADDGDVAFYMRYVGAAVSGAVTVAIADATGDMTFVVDGAADTTVVASTGVIDVSTTPYNTIQKVVNTINASPNWEAYIVDALGSDTSIDALVTTSAVNYSGGGWIANYVDTSTVFVNTVAIVPYGFTGTMDKDAVSKIYSIGATSTYGSGTSKIQIWSVAQDGTETKIYEVTGGATTVAKEVTSTGGWKPLFADQGYKLLARLANSAASASTAFNVDAATCKATQADAC